MNKLNVDKAIRGVRICAKVHSSLSSQVPSTTEPPFRSFFYRAFVRFCGTQFFL